MPQIFQVLCCYNCEMYQVHQVKKSNKWECRVCNEKQSLKKAFKIGPSRDCRSLVQKLNMQKSGQIEEKNEDSEVCERNNDWSECENKASELYDCTENLSCSFKEDFENADSLWIDDASSSCYPVSKVCEEDSAADEVDFLSENSKVYEISQCTSDSGNDFPQKIENTDQHKLSICEQIAQKKASKHPLDTQNNAMSHDTILPPFKKNRGFQIIMNAASKLN